MTIAELPGCGTDRFAVPALDGKIGRLLYIGSGCALIQWERAEKTKEFVAKKLDRKTFQVVEKIVRVPDREKPGPVTLALEVVPLEPSQGRH